MLRHSIFILPIIAGLTGCATFTAEVDPSTLCLFLDEPGWSERDTAETQTWMENYAVKWERLNCNAGE